MLRELAIGTLGSILAAVILFLTATWRSVVVRRALTAITSTFLDVDVKFVFRDGKAAELAITQALQRSARVRIFAGRGNEFQRDLYRPLLDPQQKKVRHVRILLPDSAVKPRGVDWIEQRERELEAIDPSFGTGALRMQIQTSVQFVSRHQELGVFEVRLYDAPHIGRIIITDDLLFLTLYSAVKHGRDCRVIQYGRGDIYDGFVRYFDMLWTDAHVVDGQQ